MVKARNGKFTEGLVHEWMLLPKVSINREQESGIRAANQAHVLAWGIQGSYLLSRMLILSYKLFEDSSHTGFQIFFCTKIYLQEKKTKNLYLFLILFFHRSFEPIKC